MNFFYSVCIIVPQRNLEMAILLYTLHLKHTFSTVVCKIDCNEIIEAFIDRCKTWDNN